MTLLLDFLDKKARSSIKITESDKNYNEKSQ